MYYIGSNYKKGFPFSIINVTNTYNEKYIPSCNFVDSSKYPKKNSMARIKNDYQMKILAPG